MKARIKWVENVAFMASADSGHAVVIDGPPDGGGKNLGVRPMEMMLMGMGGCTAYDVMTILGKSRQEVTNCEVELNAERADQIPSVFTTIHVHFIVTGKNLSEKVVERAIHLSAEKYCSASIMLSKTVDITHDFEIIESE